MKKLTIVALAVVLAGCSLDIDEIRDEFRDGFYGADFSGFSVYYGDFSAVRCMGDIPSWMTARVQYVVTNEIQGPEYTLYRGWGDCDCYAMLYMDIAFVRFGVKCDLALVDTGRAVVAGGVINHAVIRLPSGRLVNAQNGTTYTGQIAYVYTFDEVFNK